MVDDAVKVEKICRSLIFNTITNFMVKFVTLGIGFFLTPFILGQVGANAYGLWILISSIVSYGSLLDFGIANAVTKYIAEYSALSELQQARRLISTALCLYTGLGILAILLSAALAWVLPKILQLSPEYRAIAGWLVFLSGAGLGISLPCAIPISVLRGLQRFDLVNLIATGGTLLTTIATVTVLLLGWGLLGLVAINIPLILLMQVPSIILVKRIAPDLHFGWRGANRGLIRTVLSFSSALFVMDVAGRLQMKTDEIVIGVYLPVSSVTPYSIAHRLSELPQMLTEQFLKLLMPLASQLNAENDQARLRALFTASTRLALAGFVPLACALVILAKPFITLWVGTAYSGYSYLVLILITASLIDTSMWPAGLLLQGMARHRRLAVISLSSGLANLAISILLVRAYGLTGAALGTLIPTSLECLFFVLPYAMRTIGIRLRTMATEVALPALLPAIPMLAALYALREILHPQSYFSIFLIGGIGLMIYSAGYLVFGASPAERRVLSDTLSRATSTARRRFNWEKTGAD